MWNLGYNKTSWVCSFLLEGQHVSESLFNIFEKILVSMSIWNKTFDLDKGREAKQRSHIGQMIPLKYPV